MDSALNDVKINDYNCNFRSSAYLCQPIKIPNGLQDRTCTCTNGTPQGACRTNNLSLCASCNAGYKLNAAKTACDDINECSSNNGGCNSRRSCTNTGGSFTCGNCPAGYTNDGSLGCKACPSGHTCAGGANKPVACDVKKYVLANTCTACTTGYVCNGAIRCLKSNYVKNGVCTTCPATGFVCNGLIACETDKYVKDGVCTERPDSATCDGTEDYVLSSGNSAELHLMMSLVVLFFASFF